MGLVLVFEVGLLDLWHQLLRFLGHPQLPNHPKSFLAKARPDIPECLKQGPERDKLP